MRKSHRDGLWLDMDSLSLAITTLGTTQDSDFKMLHDLVKLIRKKIYGLQDTLASIAAKTEKLENGLRTST